MIEDDIRVNLEKHFNTPSIFLLEVKDKSYLHQGHGDFKKISGILKGTHIDLTLVWEGFQSLNLLQRHRMIYDALNYLLKSHIHALSINALTEKEYKEKVQK
jgi:BolA family transcriptional regulator, general stress-responsive regulator